MNKKKGEGLLDLSKYFHEDNTIDTKYGKAKSGKYINQDGKLGYVKKADGRYMFIQVGAYQLEDFWKINNGIEVMQYEVKFKGLPPFKGNLEGLRKQLVPNILTNKNRMANDFLSDLIIKNPNRVRTELNGGYGTLEDIVPAELSEKELNNIQKHVVDYMEMHFTPEMKNAFRLLIMLPFHWILKNDVDVNDKHFIKGVALYGWRDCGKTFIVNYVANMFSKQKIKFIGVDSFKTYAGFYGALRENVGILLVDECNYLLNKWQKEFNDIINAIPQQKVPKQGTEGGGAITNDNYTSTPVFTSNNNPNFNKSNLARIDVIHMTKQYDPNKKFLLSKGKNLLLKFGDLIATAFKENYEEIKKCKTPIEASNIILEALPLDMSNILEQRFYTESDEKDLPINLQLKRSIEEKIKRELYYGILEEYAFNFDWILRYSSENNMYHINLRKFYNYLEEVTGDTSRNFKEEILDLPLKKSSMRLNGKTLNTYTIKDNELMDWLGLESEDGKSYPYITKVKGKDAVYIKEDVFIFF